ncbi:conserved Plasmodium protein, unknown function [Plasmodium berghei]|uniref:CLP1 P-loop domain-containing protein, putative n=2 Tax=Plasmodium berghei TaxID=5821 RepID=A0A509AHZ6_PLABA|nr:CLP1 P-loop domain-containing protein, putative [Plasmodium berghei ANKA]CXH99071.1 conserved Plasmodium protein, unknown function [Plasmodium berghei]SCL91472.1 conserved Plasmodium protein, unknown function [Plasmodium berghei]SCM15476.1 conserved Plasmodium protein, unknown function [Plasmodium berghei]SCM17268.1 conserved Plasmodium protein, unknown function [Plasmodium berghei]SCN22421.1 conserved Plasmodium protein, unknown function [Plasmodium berghei]|eukprot:XP_034420074.1 CLP1 P-loop domain-containing protein, putative [Plasmodium berghei ANKA]
MPYTKGYDKCLYNFEENLKKTYDRIKKIKKNEESIYEHTKLEDSEIKEKIIYLLGLNYGEYILLRGNFRFRLIKGLVYFNGEIVKPSIEYKNVHIPDFNPMIKLIALNDMNVKCEDGMFKIFFHDNNKYENKNERNNYICNENIHNMENVEKCNEYDPYISKDIIQDNGEKELLNDINKIEGLKEDIIKNNNNKESEHFDICMKGNENIPECSENILENYLFCLNMLEDGNIKKEEFDEYLKIKKTGMINNFASNCMMDTINLYLENFPIIIAFEKKKNFWYNLYNNDPKKIINITNSGKNNSIYINSYQMSYIVKEFMIYIHNKKKYKINDILKKIEEESISRKLSTSFDVFENKKEGIVHSNCKENELNLRSYKKSKVENVENGNSSIEEKKTNYKANENCKNDENGKNDLEVSNKLKAQDYLKKLKKENIFEENFENNKNEQSIFDAISSIIIMGDKGKGKSYFVTNFINNLLNYNKNGILLLDIDVGQPIIGISGFISLYKIKSPLDIYNFFYPKKYKCVKKIFFGSCSIMDNPNLFIKCLEEIYDYLFDVYLKKNVEKIKKLNISNEINIGQFLYPLVVNTFGWIKDIGLFLLNLNILLSKADFIIQIDSLKVEKKMKQLFSKKEFYEYMFNDFLITHNDKNMVDVKDQEIHYEKIQKKAKNKYVIFNLNNKHVNLIAKEHSIFNTIIKYNYGLNESDLLFYDVSMSFKKEEKVETEKKDNKHYVNKQPYKKKMYNISNNDDDDNNTKKKKKNGFTKFSENNKNITTSHIEKGEWNGIVRQYNDYGINGQNKKVTKDFRDYWKNYCYKPLLDYIDNSIIYKNDHGKKHTKYRNYFYKRYQSIINPMINKYTKNESINYKSEINNLKNFEKIYYDNFSNYDKNQIGVQSTENSPFLVNKNKMDFENKKDNYANNESIKNYDDYIKKIENLFEKKCIRIINFVSYKKNNYYENLNKPILQNKNIPILPKNLRAYRFFCFLFFKFKKIIFYMHSFSLYDGINDFFMKHEHKVAEYVFQIIVKNEGIGSDIFLNDQNTQNYSYMEIFNNSSMEKEEIKYDTFFKDNVNEMNKNFYQINEYKDENNLKENDYINAKEKLYDDDKNEDIEIESSYWNDTIYKKKFLFNCVAFDLKNIKLSNIGFNKNSNDIYEEGNFLTYKYFFNNIICLCNDNIENNISSNRSDEKNSKNNKKLNYNITRIDIGANFENINSVIKKTELEKNNVKLVGVSEHFTHILTGYIKLIYNMKLIIYLPYWFKDFDVLKNVNTFVSGMNLIPYNINDMINNYPYYVDIVTAKEDEIFKFLKEEKYKEIEQGNTSN